MTPTKTINFSFEYTKLYYQETAMLVAVYKTTKQRLSKLFLSYDTCYHDKNEVKFYNIPDTELIFLIFLGDQNIPFTTIRKYTAKKWSYYKNTQGQIFELKRGPDKYDNTQNDNDKAMPEGFYKD